jgi:predicted TIM-barrel fold metal-dependent hydrolase
MRKIIDAHLHIDELLEEPGDKFDFFNPPESRIATEEVLRLMDEQGVGKAVIMQHPNGPINEAVALAVREYPHRFRGAMIINPNDSGCLATIEENKKRGLSIIKLEMFGMSLLYPGIRLDSERFYEIFSLADKLGLVVAVDPFRMDMPGYQSDALNKVIPAFPGVKFVICHLGFPLAELMKEGKYKKKWREMSLLAKYKNVWFDISAMPDMFGNEEKYPYNSATILLKEFITDYGADKVLWGSDILGELRRCGYKQLIDMFEASDTLTEKEKNALFFENAEKVYFNEEG